MRARVLLLLATTAAMSGAALVACVDLFHSTGDVLTACQLDAQTPGCVPEANVEAGVDAGTDFCTWSDDEARQNAAHACAWLGACESPLGDNAFGSCMFQALLAFDCNANPDHPVKGKTHALWDCLWQAQSCGAVNACVFPQGPQVCGGGPFTTCATQGGTVNGDVRVACASDGAAPKGENCALWGQTCGGDLSKGICGGSTGAGALDCTGPGGCSNTMLHACNDAGEDIGIDCASNGAQQCGGFPDVTNARWVACLPANDAGTCTPDASATCSHGLATSCPAGILETINCQLLLQNVDSCNPGPLSPPFDWTSPCVITDEGGAADAATCSDSCEGAVVSSCYRGASFTVDCSKLPGLGKCQMVQTDHPSPNAACVPSSP
ncbi:MAG TPA: hypothetical protein VGL81_21340 [Polyangiaceae bacterium]|jgi:hypothetical protein